ncbi:hypothetical protein N7501_002398 [Penicillium viridicatum]|nr:hypothetical protein N7501_002398 [Penicillium viridicatum]
MPLAIISVTESSVTDMSGAYVVQDARFHSLRAALKSLADKKEMIEQLEEHTGLMRLFSRPSHLRLLQANPGPREFYEYSPTSSTLTAFPSRSMGQTL